MDDKLLTRIRSAYGPGSNMADILESRLKRLRERIFGIDYHIFDKTIRYYSEVKGERFTKQQALSRALDKVQHKNAWYRLERYSIEGILHFYQEVHVYPFRQPYLKRFGGHRWYRNLVKHIELASILEYGCGSAVLTEYLIERFPDLRYTVADIPSTTLDFVNWKKKTYGYPYNILTITKGKDVIPMIESYDLIICEDVLEHTPNPLDIVATFVDRLSPEGVLLSDFLNAPGGENLERAIEQRESVKSFLKQNLIALKAIDEPQGNDGLYVKDSD